MEFDADEHILVHQYEEQLWKDKEKCDRAKLLKEQTEVKCIEKKARTKAQLVNAIDQLQERERVAMKEEKDFMTASGTVMQL